jgi:hypothetical protein
VVKGAGGVVVGLAGVKGEGALGEAEKGAGAGGEGLEVVKGEGALGEAEKGAGAGGEGLEVVKGEGGVVGRGRGEGGGEGEGRGVAGEGAGEEAAKAADCVQQRWFRLAGEGYCADAGSTTTSSGSWVWSGPLKGVLCSPRWPASCM